MASSLPSLDAFECAVCMEFMIERRPIALSCLHTFCTPCIKKLCERSPLCCPKCRKETFVPDNDVEKLTVNFELVQIMEEVKNMKKSTTNSKNALCETCLRQEKYNQHVGFCVQCKRNLCKECIDRHMKIAIFKNHEIVLQEIQPTRHRENICARHDEILQYVCTVCLEAICVDCTNHDSHKDHIDKLQPLEDEIAKIKAIHNKVKSKVEEYIEELRLIKQSVTSDKAIANATMNELNTLHESIKRKLLEVKHLLQDASTNKLGIEKADGEINKLINQALRHQNKLQKADNCSDLEYLTYYKLGILDSNYIQTGQRVRHKVQTYKTPEVYIDEYFAKKNFDQRSVGEIKELSPDVGHKAPASNLQRPSDHLHRSAVPPIEIPPLPSPRNAFVEHRSFVPIATPPSVIKLPPSVPGALSTPIMPQASAFYPPPVSMPIMPQASAFYPPPVSMPIMLQANFQPPQDQEDNYPGYRDGKRYTSCFECGRDTLSVCCRCDGKFCYDCQPGHSWECE